MLARDTELFNSRGNAAATIALLLAAQPISPSQFAKAENDEPACRLSRVRPSVIDQPLSRSLSLLDYAATRSTRNRATARFISPPPMKRKLPSRITSSSR